MCSLVGKPCFCLVPTAKMISYACSLFLPPHSIFEIFLLSLSWLMSSFDPLFTTLSECLAVWPVRDTGISEEPVSPLGRMSPRAWLKGQGNPYRSNAVSCKSTTL